MRKLSIIVFFIFICMSRQVVAENLTQRNGLPNVIEYVLNCFIEEQQDKDLILVDKISDFDECGQISKLGFIFDYYKVVSMPMARDMITGLVNSLLKKINASEKLKNYLSITPFTPNNIAIRIRLRHKDCGFVYPVLGNIAYVSAVDGLVIYDTVNSFTYDLDTLRTENFVDAVKISSRKH